MKKWTSVILMIIILIITFTGCSNESSVNEDAQAFLEETEGISSDETALTSETAELPENDDRPVGEKPFEVPLEDIPINDLPLVRVGVPAGLPALSMLGAMKDSEENGRRNIEYDIIKSTAMVTPKLIEKEYDVILLPTHMAAIAYSKSPEYKLAGTISWGASYVISSDDMTDISELRGKEITSFEEGQVSDVVFRYVLEQNGIDPDVDVSITYIDRNDDLATQLIKSKSSIAVVSEPVLNTVLNRRKSMQIVFDIPNEWAAVTGSLYGYPQTSVVISNDLIENHPAVVGGIMRGLDKSAEWINEETEAAAEYSNSLNLDIRKRVIVNSVERANIQFVPAFESRADIEAYLKILMKSSKKLIGGEIPDEEFYFIPPRR